MNEIFETLIQVANATGRPVSEVLRHHFLEAALRRLSIAGDTGFVLRGSMITRLWAAPFPRIANDLDFLGMFPYSASETAHRFFPTLATEAPDCVRFDVPRCRVAPIWEGSEFPGVRLTLFADVLGEPHVTTVDVGFGDPLVPGAEWVNYRFLMGDVAHVWAVHPLTMLAWKLHGLAEWGHVRWRPKDLLDLWLLTNTPITDTELLAHAVRVAFESRHYTVAAARETLEDPYWNTFSARARWNRFRAEQAGIPIPESVVEVRDTVRSRLAPALAIFT